MTCPQERQGEWSGRTLTVSRRFHRQLESSRSPAAFSSLRIDLLRPNCYNEGAV